MMAPGARVRVLSALILDEADRRGRSWHPQAVHAAASRLLSEGRTPAALLAAAAADAADPAGGPMRWHDDPDAWTGTPPPATDATRCRVCGHTAHRCARLASVVAPAHRHPFTPDPGPTSSATATASGPAASGPPSSSTPRACADCGAPTPPNRVRCSACAAAAFATPTPSPGATPAAATRPAVSLPAFHAAEPTHPDPIGRQTHAQPLELDPPTLDPTPAS